MFKAAERILIKCPSGNHEIKFSVFHTVLLHDGMMLICPLCNNAMKINITVANRPTPLVPDAANATVKADEPPF